MLILCVNPTPVKTLAGKNTGKNPSCRSGEPVCYDGATLERLVAGSYPAPFIRDCQIKSDLLHKITLVHRQISDLYRRELEAMQQGDKAARLIVAGQIESAQKRRTILLIEFQDHVEEHGC